MFWLAALALYAGGRVLDIFWALWSRSWPLTLIFYLPFALPLELAFYFHSRRFVRKRSEELHTTFVGEPDAAEALRCWAHILSDRPPAELEELLRGWFLGEGEPRRGDYVRLVAFTVYNTTPEQLSTRQRDQVGGLVEAIEVGLARELPAGVGDGVRPMAYSLDALEACAKPLAYYLLLQSAHAVLGVALRLCGFTQRVTTTGRGPRVRYWHRAPRGAASADAPPSQPPLVLLHGVGGLLPYALLLVQLRLLHSDGHIFVPVFPHCSLAALPALALTKRPPLPHELVHAIREMLSRHAPTAKGAAFLAHSLGTAALASIVKRAPELALATTFVDPICFELYSRHVLYNFLYARPRFSRRTAQHYAQRKLATEEPSVQDCFRRGFWWSQHWLAPTDLCCDTAVVLSGRDAGRPARDPPRVRSRLASPNLPFPRSCPRAERPRPPAALGVAAQEGDLARGRLPRDVVARLAADAPRRAAPHDPPPSDDGRRRRRRTCRRRRRRHRSRGALVQAVAALLDLAALAAAARELEHELGGAADHAHRLAPAVAGDRPHRGRRDRRRQASRRRPAAVAAGVAARARGRGDLRRRRRRGARATAAAAGGDAAAAAEPAPPQAHGEGPRRR
jgi:hypothetical protein